MLRMAATVVVSLGAGWLARDLTTPARDLARGPTLDAVRAQDAAPSRRIEDVTQEEDEPDAAASLIRLEVMAEDESVERQAAVSDFADPARGNPRSPGTSMPRSRRRWHPLPPSS